MQQQTKQNKKKNEAKKRFQTPKQHNTRPKIHQTQQQEIVKKSLSTNLISSTAPWHQDVQSAVPIQQPYVEPLSLPPGETLGGNDWGKSLVWGVGFFFVASQMLLPTKSDLCGFPANSSWVMGWKIWERFLSGGRAPQQHKNRLGRKGRRETHIMPAKIREMNLSIPFLPRVLEDFLWSLLSKGWPAFQVKVKFIPNSFHSKNVDQQKNVPGSKGPTFSLWIFSKLMILLFNSLLQICWQLGWILYKSYQSYHLQNKWWVRWFLWSNITGGMTSQNYWDGKNGIIPLVTVAGRGIVVRSKPLYIEREVSHKN